MKDTMRSLWRKIPIEWYFLLLATGATFFILFRFGLSGSAARSAMSHVVLFFYFFGGSYFILGIFLFDIYFLVRFLGLICSAWIGHNRIPLHRAGRILGEFMFLTASLAIALLDLGIMTSVVDRAWQVKTITTASNMLAAIDVRVTGGYPMIWLGNFLAAHGLDSLSIGAYDLLVPLLSAFFIYAIFFRQTLLRKFLLFFFVAAAISFPFWFAVPALSPYHFYAGDIPSQDVPISTIKQFSAYHPSGVLTAALDSAAEHQVDEGSSYRDVTNFPSMHAAWGAGLVYFGIVAFVAGAAIALIPWFLFEMAGALINGEHYAVDLVAGILVACAAIWVTDRLLDIEKRYYKGKTSFTIFAMMREDVGWIMDRGNIFCRWICDSFLHGTRVQVDGSKITEEHK